MSQKQIVVIITALSGCFLFVTGLLFYEYRSLVFHREYLEQLKLEYRMNLLEVKKVLTDYQHTKLRLGQLESVLESCDYAPEALEYNSSSTIFDEKAKVFSSDSEEQEVQELFMPINRDLVYLKEQAQEYIKEHNLELLFRCVPEEVWLEYTDAALIKPQVPVLPRKPASRKKGTRAASTLQKKRSSSELFSWPIKHSSFWLSSLYGRRKNANGTWGFHKAIDMAALKGTPVQAAASGIVIEVREAKTGYGKTILIKHNNKYKTRYAHLNAIHVKVGQKVARGMHIGDVGDTGFVRKSGRDASHLHFELYQFGERVNPLYYLT